MSSKLLVKLLRTLGIHRNIFNVLSSWLERRSAFVIVDNTQSHHFCLKDMVFQGTVLGPPLWNLFFVSCRHVVHAHHFTKVVFADDLNCYRKYHRDISNVSISKDLKSCQSSLHDWGRTHHVESESTKESMHVLCSRNQG